MLLREDTEIPLRRFRVHFYALRRELPDGANARDITEGEVERMRVELMSACLFLQVTPVQLLCSCCWVPQGVSRASPGTDSHPYRDIAFFPPVGRACTSPVVFR